MKAFGSYQAKTHLPAILERVSKGEKITITRHGVPIAFLIPASPAKNNPPAEAIAQLRRFRQGRKLSPFHLKAIKEEGRK